MTEKEYKEWVNEQIKGSEKAWFDRAEKDWAYASMKLQMLEGNKVVQLLRRASK